MDFVIKGSQSYFRAGNVDKWTSAGPMSNSQRLTKANIFYKLDITSGGGQGSQIVNSGRA